MNRELFFRACRAASELTETRELTVFGSSAVIPWITGVDPSEELWLTSDVDIDPGSQEKADRIEAGLSRVASERPDLAAAAMKALSLTRSRLSAS